MQSSLPWRMFEAPILVASFTSADVERQVDFRTIPWRMNARAMRSEKGSHRRRHRNYGRACRQFDAEAPERNIFETD